MRVFFLLLFLMSTPVAADVIHMKNGDRITGEIKQIWGGDVSIEPSYSDAFDVDINDIESIETDQAFDIVLYDGRHSEYRFNGIDAAGNVLLSGDDREIAVAFTDIKKVEEIEDYFEWQSRTDLSSTISKGNTDSKALSLNGSLQYKIGLRRTLFELNLLREEVENITVRDSGRLNLSYNYSFSEPWFYAVNGDYEQDEIALIDERYSVNPAIGYDIWDDPGKTLNIQVGSGYQSETIDGETNTGIFIDWRLRYSHEFLSGDLELYHNHQISRHEDGGKNGEEKKYNVVFNSTSGIRYDITDDIYLNMELKYDRESEPADGVEGEDLIFLVGAGIEFD